MGFGAFDGLGGGVPGHGVVVGGHGDGASGVGGEFEPMVAFAFDPVFDGLEYGLVGGGVEADGAPVVVGVVDGEGAEVIDDSCWCSVVEECFNDLVKWKFEELFVFGVPEEDFFSSMEAVAAFGGVPEGVGVADSEGGEADDAADDAGGGVGGEADDEVADEVFGGGEVVVRVEVVDMGQEIVDEV